MMRFVAKKYRKKKLPIDPRLILITLQSKQGKHFTDILHFVFDIKMSLTVTTSVETL